MKKFFAAIMIAMLAFSLAACGGGGNDEPEVVDCDLNPEHEDCEVVLECETGYEEVNGVCELIDTRTPAEIAADEVIDNWDGSMEHVEMMMENMSLDDAVTITTEFLIDVTDTEGVNHIGQLVITDEVINEPSMVIKRTVSGEIDEETFEFVLIIEETPTGVIVYYDTAFIRTLIAEDPSNEVQDVLDALDANGKWFMFKFDDSLENLVEIEVLKEMVVALLYQEFGNDVFTIAEDELNLALGVVLADYGFDLSDFIDLVIASDYDAAELMLDNVNYDQLILDLDQIHLVPEIVAHMTMYEADMLLLDPTWVLAEEVLYLETYGTEMWLNQLTEQEIENILAVHDPVLGEVYNAYVNDDLDHFFVMLFLNDPDVQMALADVPGLDVPAFTATMDNLDYDAFYEEDVDIEALLTAMRAGYGAYDIFVADLAATAPQTASILAHFGGINGLVDELQMYAPVYDDIQLGIDNLSMFEQYITPEYYLMVGLVDNDIEITTEQHILTTATIDGSTTALIFEDFIEDLYWYLDAFETFEMPYVDVLNCPEMEVCESYEDIQMTIDDLSQLGDIVMTVEYDPFHMDELQYEVNYTDYVQQLILLEDPLDTTVVNEVSFSIHIENDADPMVPDTDITDVNMVLEDFAKFSLIMQGRDYLNDVMDYYMMNPLEIPPVLGTNITLADLEMYVGTSMAFDEELSYFKLTGDPINGYDYEMQLFWLDGTAVFTEPLLLSELNLQFAAGTGAPSRAEFVYWRDKIDSDNFNMTKLFLLYMWEKDTPDYVEPPM